MVRIAYEGLKFDHVVVFKQERSTFATARECSGKTRIFLVFGDADSRVYTRNGLASSWEPLEQPEGKLIRSAVEQAVAAGIPVYRINGTSEPVVGPVSGN